MNCPHCGNYISYPEGEYGKSKDVVSAIEHEVMRYFGIDRIQLYTTYGSRELSDARHCYAYLLFRLARFSKKQIGFIMHNHHTTIIKAIRKIDNMNDINDPLAGDVARVKANVMRSLNNTLKVA